MKKISSLIALCAAFGFAMLTSAHANPAANASPAAKAAHAAHADHAGHNHGDNDCAAMAAEKKLGGAAKASFIKKCERDAAVASPDAAKAACENTATDKKLAGAAKNSFVAKCVRDATAAK